MFDTFFSLLQNGFYMITRRLGAAIVDILQTVVLAVAIFLVVYLFLFQPHQVKGDSMFPNMLDGEYLLTDKLSYRLGKPDRGDIVVFAAPPNPSEDYIKRIIGLPGESVLIRDGKVYINGSELRESYLPDSLITSAGQSLSEGSEMVLADDEYFVLGDNRPNSSDSRRWGPVKRKKLVGRAWVVYWPPKEAGAIDHAEY